MIYVGKNLWRPSGPSHLLKLRYLETIAQNHVQMAFGYLQRAWLHNLSVQTAQVLSHLHSKEGLPDVEREHLVFQFVPIASCPGTRHNWRECSSVFFSASFQVFIYIDKILLGLLFSMLKSPNSLPSLSLWPSPVCLCVSCTEEPRNAHSTPDVASSMLRRGEGLPSSNCWQYFV